MEEKLYEKDEIKEKIVNSVEYENDGITYFLADSIEDFSDMLVDKIYMTRAEAESSLEVQIKSLE